MSENGWIPYDYFDEVIPELKGHPTQWIGRLDDGAPGLLDFHGEKSERALADGAVVEFIEHRNHGPAVLTIAEDGSWAVNREMPGGANYVWCREVDISGNDVSILIKDWKEAAADETFGPDMEAGDYAVSYGWWGEKVPFRFDAGNNSFVQVAS